MKYIFILCCFFSLQKTPELKPWHANYNLTWQDFKGDANYNIKSAASTASGIYFRYSLQQKNKKDIGFNTEVVAYFYPEKSWCKKGVVTKHILNHEQIHFDITELFSRKFRQRLAHVKPQKNTKKVLNKLYATIRQELQSMQNLYDTETNHSINKVQQAKWNVFVEKALNKLDNYKSTDLK